MNQNLEKHEYHHEEWYKSYFRNEEKVCKMKQKSSREKNIQKWKWLSPMLTVMKVPDDDTSSAVLSLMVYWCM